MSELLGRPRLAAGDRYRRFAGSLRAVAKRIPVLRRAAVRVRRRVATRAGGEVASPPAHERRVFVPRPHDELAGGLRILILGEWRPSAGSSILLAAELVRRGHEVTVMTRGDTSPRVGLERGVRVHYLSCPAPGLIPEAPAELDGFATAALRELERIRTSWEPDVAYGPLCDLSLLAVGRHVVGLPLVLDLNAPATTNGAAQSSGHSARNPVNDALERELLARAVLVRGADERIVDLANRHPGALHACRLDVAQVATDNGDVAAATLQAVLRRAARTSAQTAGATAST